MKDKINKNFYLFRETIDKLEKLSKANNCRNISNYLDMLVENESKNNQQAGKTDRDLMLHMLTEIEVLRQDFKSANRTYEQWASMANGNFKIIANEINNFPKATTEAPSANEELQNKFTKVMIENQSLKEENEKYKRYAQSYNTHQAIVKFQSDVRISFYYYRKLNREMSRFSVEEKEQLKKTPDNQFNASLKSLFDAKKIGVTNLPDDEIINHFIRKSKESIK